MRLLGFAIALIALVASACSDDSCNCPAVVSTAVVVTVVDAKTSENVEDPAFSEKGTPLPAVCGDELDAGVCDKWELNLTTTGTHTISVAAPGQVAQTFSVELTSYTGLCGCHFINPVTPVHVALTP